MYIQPIGDIYEAFATAALFLLVLDWVAPDGIDREQYFDKLELRDRRGRVQPGGSLRWFQVIPSLNLDVTISVLTPTTAYLERGPGISNAENTHHRRPNHHAIFRRILRELLQPQTRTSLSDHHRLRVRGRCLGRHNPLLPSIAEGMCTDPQAGRKDLLVPGYRYLPDHPGSHVSR